MRLGVAPGRRGASLSELRLDLSWFQALSPPWMLAAAAVMTLAVAAGDHLTGADVGFTLLYLGPIGFATWFLGLRAGVPISALSAALSLGTDLATRAVPLPAAVSLWNLFGQLGVFLVLAVILESFKSRLVLEQQLARTDPLTGVPNRRAFLEAAQMELERARRHGRPLTVVYLDADDFKAVNDHFGHEGGDALLAMIGATLRSATRSVDTVARLGGDEFGLLLPETDGPTAEALVARLRATLAAALREEGWPAGFSYGVVTDLAPTESVDEMMSRADELMYEAKRTGKDAVRAAVVDLARRAAS